MYPLQRRPQDLSSVLGGQETEELTPEEIAALQAATPTGAGAALGDTSVLSDSDLAQLAGVGADVSAGQSIPELQSSIANDDLDPQGRSDLQQQLALAARRRLAGV